MALEKISDKQKEILEFIKSEILNRGYPPSVRDICEGVHLKSHQASMHISRHWSEKATSEGILPKTGL